MSVPKSITYKQGSFLLESSTSEMIKKIKLSATACKFQEISQTFYNNYYNNYINITLHNARFLYVFIAGVSSSCLNETINYGYDDNQPCIFLHIAKVHNTLPRLCMYQHSMYIVCIIIIYIIILFVLDKVFEWTPADINGSLSSVQALPISCTIETPQSSLVYIYIYIYIHVHIT